MDIFSNFAILFINKFAGKDMNIGVELIKSHLKSMSTGPGVYRMVGAKAQILYIGKAKNLTKRLANYTVMNRLTERIKTMVNQTLSLEIINTKSETEAILLEATLIKSLQPRYNILLKDDKSFPYIVIREDHDFGQILKFRGKKTIPGKYFGPFASVKAVNDTILFLQQIFLLRPCSDNYFASRTRPCLQYQIKRCSAPCVGKISKEDYKHLVNQAYDFLTGNSNNLITDLTCQMEIASNDMEYEKAAKIRDRIKTLANVQAKRNVIAELKDADVIAIYRDVNEYCVQIFFYRAGQNYGNKSFFFDHFEEATEQEVLRSFITQFYQNLQAPKQIFINHPLDEQELIEQAFKTKISIPKAGAKFNLITLALENAKSALERKFSNKEKTNKSLASIGKLFKLPTSPRRIDVFDNSHISGTNAVGAMIVADESGLNKKAYRKFNITETQFPDDYAMLKEVLKRRYGRLKKEFPEYTPGIWPDIVLIDGGAGHLSTAKKVMDDLGLDLHLVGISKGPDRNAGKEEFHQVERPAFTLPRDFPEMKYLQILRDEAHRFAITTHRAKRSRELTNSLLDEIEQIGPKRKKALISHFGSPRAISAASFEDIAKVPGINKKTAEIIYNYFHH